MDVGIFSFTTPNLGDEMQSYAVLGHLNRVTQFLDRDRLAQYDGPDTHVVFNSYFFLGNGFGHRWPILRSMIRPPRRTIHPIWHGFHPARDELFRGQWRGYLRSQGAIGCRDTVSVARLRAAGADAYFSGCLTLFLSHVFPKLESPRRGVYFVDLSQEAERCMPAEIASRATRLSTFPPAGSRTDALGRWGMLAELISMLATAELVVTRRLHVALPCVGFGTPLVVLPNTHLAGIRDRMSGYDRMMTIIYPNEMKERLAEIDWSNPPLGSIPAEIAERYDQFCNHLEDLGIQGPTLDSTSPLDRIGSDRIRIRNTLDRSVLGDRTGTTPLGFVRLRLGARTFPVQVKFWTDQYLDLSIASFPGLSRLDLQVEATVSHRSRRWIACGSLHDLVIES